MRAGSVVVVVEVESEGKMVDAIADSIWGDEVQADRERRFQRAEEDASGTEDHVWCLCSAAQPDHPHNLISFADTLLDQADNLPESYYFDLRPLPPSSPREHLPPWTRALQPSFTEFGVCIPVFVISFWKAIEVLDYRWNRFAEDFDQPFLDFNTRSCKRILRIFKLLECLL